MQLLLAVLALPLASAQLNELAQKAGKLYFGTATDNEDIGFQNKTYLQILNDTKEFGQLTPSNGQKWFAVEPELGVFNYSYGDVVADIATANKQILRCHNLVWHSQLAPWGYGISYLEQRKPHRRSHRPRNQRSQTLVQPMLRLGRGQRSPQRRRDLSQRHLPPSPRPEYIRIAFRAAAAADPHAKLYYNDYNIESPNNKSAAVRALVRDLKKEGIRIDGVGLQSHFTAGSAPSIDNLIWTMEGYTKLGVEVALTELDIRIMEPETSSNLAQQSSDYKNAVGACMLVDGCVGVTVWDFWDPVSWVPGVFTGMGSACLWFGNFTKHPAYQGVVEALTNDTRRGFGGGGGHNGGWW
ncbi:hypothetical protein G7Y89_g7167 [Cudoniella acicularis]|uniref:Beta-xylanase n=1 Tax=Cudoniella acicularis TaxID=354080 RepID=A0A8H4W2C3_9HELO|nr:hypothetical protein G7Y89_g7167 [Cudoniella acicularis]